jgi:transposase InsO family protein
MVAFYAAEYPFTHVMDDAKFMVQKFATEMKRAGYHRVERPMRDNGLHARHKRRDKVTTDSRHGLPVAENLLARNFTPTAPNQVWTSDITSLWTDEG